MAKASTPQYIFDLLQSELIEYNKNILENIATKYNLNKENLLKEFLPKELKIIPNEKECIEIIHKGIPRRPPEKESDRCMARIWNRGKGGQCIRLKLKNCDFCSQHKEKNKHGRIDEAVPRDLFQNKSNALYK
jgi:hypothetical protein